MKDNNRKLTARLINPNDIYFTSEKIVPGKVVKVSEFAISNDIGGTTYIDNIGTVEARIIKVWYDYETGTHAKAELLDKKIIEKVNELGTTGYTPEHFKNDREEIYKSVLKGRELYNPSIISISEFNVEDDL